MPPTHRSEVFEITAVIVTGLGKFIFVDYLHLKFWYILSAGLFWIGYMLYKVSTQKSSLHNWGFRKEGFLPSLKIVLPIAIITVSGFIVYGIIQRTIIFNWHIIPVMILYPVWGTLQQFLIIGIIAGALSHSSLPKAAAIFFTAVLFSIVHYPSIPLVIATFILAVFYTWLFLKHKNIWILGFFHGWLGGLFYFFVLHRDPWLEFLDAIR